jgi:hypothetical protein
MKRFGVAKVITLDSISLLIPLEAIIAKNFYGDVIERIRDGNIVENVEYKVVEGIEGLKYIEFNRLNGTMKIQLSAKLLEEDYYRLISIETIELVFYKLNYYGLVKLNTTKAIETALLLNCDFTKNLKVGKVSSYIFDIYRASERISKDWFVKLYRKNTSIEFEQKRKRNRIRAVIYDKHKEMIKEMKRRQKKGIEYNLGVEKFKNVLRFEVNTKTLQNIRELAGLEDKEDTLLLKVLKSKENPNLKVFEKIFHNHIGDYLNIDNIRKEDIRKFFEMKGVVSELKSIQNYLNLLLEKGYSQASAYRIVNELRQIASNERTNKRIKEIYELLKSA